MDPKSIPISLQSLPMPFARALLRNDYSKADSVFSVTQLLSPPQRTYLKIANEEIRSTYSMFAAFIGTSMHSTFESNTMEIEGEISERRLYTKICDVSVSGQIDLYCNNTIYDYKTVRSPKDKIESKHYDQVQMNGYLAEVNGLKVLQVAVIYIDITWQHSRSVLDPKYPQSPWMIYTQPYDREHALKLFNKTVPEHLAALKGSPRNCTPEEQWEKPAVYAITTKGAKRASKLCATQAEADELKKPGQFVEVRPGAKTYCGTPQNSFCGLCHVCPQYKLESMSSSSEEF